jgi:hypothetical protein
LVKLAVSIGFHTFEENIPYMRRIFGLLFLYTLSTATLAAQATNPPAQNLPYSENFASLTSGVTIYPTGWIGWQIPGSGAPASSPIPVDAPSGDAALVAGTASSTSSNVYNFEGKIGFLNSGTAVRSVATAINTTGLSNIQVAYDAMAIRVLYNATNDRRNAMYMQYRVGTSGTFTTVPTSLFYSDTIPNQTSGTNGIQVTPISITLPALCNNQPVVQLRWLNKDSTGGGARPSFAIDNVNITGTVGSGIDVSLSASTTTASEAAQTAVTITATAVSPVINTETVTLQVSGAGITTGDYTLSSNTITIPAGQTTGTATFTVIDDALNEGTEIANIGIGNISPGLAIGSPAAVNITILDNDSAVFISALNTPTAQQDFDLLDTVGTALSTFPRGVYLHEAGSGVNADGFYRANDGNSNAGDGYSYGLNGSPERALGSVTSGTVSPIHYGLQVVNNAGSPVNALTINYTGEQWRKGTATDDSLAVEYSLDASSLTTGNWTAIPALTFTPPNTAASGAVNGNLPTNRSVLTHQLLNFGGLPAGAKIWLRWTDNQVSGSNDGMSIDDFFIVADNIVCPAPSQQVSALSTSNLTGNSVDLSWNSGNATEVIVIARQGSAVADFPQNGQTYTGNASFGTPGTNLGTGFVVYRGPASTTTLTVTNLNGGDTYHFAAFGIACNPPEYNLTTPPTANVTIPLIPALSVTPAGPLSFNTQATFASATQTLTVSGSNLSQDVQLQTSAPFQLSLASTGPFSTQVTIPAPGGSVPATSVFVRYLPSVAGTNADSVVASVQGVNDVIIHLNGTATAAGTLPAPFALCSGNYAFDSWAATNAAGTYPANMIFHSTTTADPGINAAFIQDYTAAYNLTSGSRINGLGNNGVEFRNIGTAGTSGFVGAAILALNSTGRDNIQVSWLNGNAFDGARDYRMVLQYRLPGDAWQTLPGSEFQVLNFALNQTQALGPISLPAACNNQPQVLLRWVYFQQAGSPTGIRPGIRLDSIRVNSQSLTGPLATATLLSGNETASIPSTLTGAVNTNTDGASLIGFEIADGVSDNLPTEVTAITLETGTGHTAGALTDVIGAAALFENGVKIADGVVGASDIQFTGLTISVADAGTEQFTVRATLATTGQLVDGSNIQLRLQPSGIQSGTPCTSTQFQNFTAFNSDGLLNQITVNATRLLLSNISATITETLPFSVTVSAVDDNGNIDTNARAFTASLGTPGTGNLSSVTGLIAQAGLNGVYTWSDLAYDVAETMQLVVTDTGSVVLSTDTLLNVIPLCVEPTQPATAFVFDNVDLNDMDISWSNGNGTGRLVIARQGAPVVNTPQDGIAYTANAQYGTPGTELGSGFVVFIGTGNSITVTGLLENTTYHFAVFEFDCDPELYLNTNPAIGSQTTGTSSIHNENTDAFRVFPNPVRAGKSIQVSQGGNMRICDMSGRTVRTLAGNEIQTSGLVPGVYMLFHENGSVTRIVIM